MASGASVTLVDVGFAGDSAVGGNGGSGAGPSAGFVGSGGGLGGNGGVGDYAGGGGVGGAGGAGFSGAAGGAGLIPGAGSGGAAGFSGGGGGPSGGGGGGGVDGGPGDGYYGGAGGFGGGGGAGDFGGTGGFGGGGGGGNFSYGGGGGPGGFGGGGTAGGTNAGGGGGLGAGGDIFVQQGGTLAIEGGALGVGSGGPGYGGSSGGHDGEALGTGLFIQGYQSVTLDPATGATLTVSGVIADQAGNGGTGTLVIGTGGSGGTVVLDATNTYTGRTVLQSGTLVLAAAGAAGTGAILFTGDPTLVVSNADLSGSSPDFYLANTIDSFGTLDTIDLPGISFDPLGSATLVTIDALPTLEVVEHGTSIDFYFAGSIDFSGLQFHATQDGGTGTLITDTLCFLGGTRLRTPRGETEVELLKPGDLVVTADGRPVPVRWIGRSIASCHRADPLRVLPIRIRSGALGPNCPARDLLVSPNHGILIGDVLAHASALVNGVSVTREYSVPPVFIYYHIELDTHSLLLAEGAPAESFLDGVEMMAFFNWADRVPPQTVEEMPYPRAKSARQLPRSIREQLARRASALYGEHRSAA